MDADFLSAEVKSGATEAKHYWLSLSKNKKGAKSKPHTFFLIT